MPDYNNLLARVVAIQKELVTNCDAVPYVLHTQGGGNYWINRVDTITTTSNSEDFDAKVVTVEMTYIAGEKTQGYNGEIENALYTQVPLIEEEFNEREGLQSTAFPDEMTELMEARITLTRPMVILENGGTGNEQVAAIFTLTCLFDSYIRQVYD